MVKIMKPFLAALLLLLTYTDSARAQADTQRDSLVDGLDVSILQGTWTAHRDEDGFWVTLRGGDDFDWYHTNVVRLSDLPGDSVALGLVRDAGRLSLDGRRRGDRAAGFYTFTPNPRFNAEVERFGYHPFDLKQLFLLTAIDAHLSEIGRLPGLGYPHLSTEDMTAMLIHGAMGDHIIELKRLGYENLSVEDLIATRIQGVDRHFVESIKALGYDRLTIDELISMRALDVTVDYIKEMNRVLAVEK